MNQKKLYKVYRASGMPINIEDQDKFALEYQKVYDKVMTKFQVSTEKSMDPKLSERVNKLLTRVEKILIAKYPLTADWEMPKSKRAWIQKIKQYGVISTVVHAETRDICFVVMDIAF